uniref:RRM domain-containing protein n=1 Tax=Macrostomum lignano TaxID=282301 RepID=A0A1I8H435_9PLAT
MKQGISEAVATEVQNLFATGAIGYRDLSQEALACLKDFPEDQINSAVKEFSETDLSEIKDRSAHLVSILRVWHEAKAGGHAQPSHGPNEATIKALLERTGFHHEVTSGQRHYGPPSNWDGEPPTHQSEVFLGKLPKDLYEDELVPLCEQSGSIYEMRIMLNDYEIRPGKKIKVNVSTPNLRLFVGNIPKTKSRDEIMEEFSKLTENLKDVIVYSTPDDLNTQRKNRGFCFLHFDSHIDAANAKKKLGRRGVRIFNSDIYVDWADPIDDNEEVNLSDVKILYVKNLSSDVTEDQVREAFGSHGPLEKVKRMKDYAFVHFEEREHALKAMEALNGHEGLGKGLLEVSLARPVSDKVKQKREQRKMEHHTHRWGGGAPAVGAAAFDGGAAGGFYNSRGVGAAPFRSGGRGGRWAAAAAGA